MRNQIDAPIAECVKENDLGTIICSYCDGIIDTLPTNGVKTKYMVCDKEACREQEGSASA